MDDRKSDVIERVMMKNAHKVFILIFVMVVVPVIAVWYTAWPLVTPWNLPKIENAQMDAPINAALDKDQLQALNKWLEEHRTGWGTKGEKPPKGSAAIHLIFNHNDNNKVILDNANHVFECFFWHFKHGGDVIAIKIDADGRYRMRSLDEKESENFRHILAQ